MGDWAATQMPRLRRSLIRIVEDTIPDDWEISTAAIAASELTWVTRDMTTVAVDAAEEMPEWTPAAVVPAPAGIVCWQSELPELQAGDTDLRWSAPVAGVHWSVRAGALHILVLCRSDHVPREYHTPPGGLAPLAYVLPQPTTVAITNQTTGSAAGLVALLGTTWILSEMPTVATPRTVNGAGGSGRWTAREREVSIVDLRRQERTPTERDPAAAGREYHHRWRVKAHWRQQACGPGRKWRRPTWIPIHIKGPEGAPLLEAEQVMRWKR